MNAKKGIPGLPSPAQKVEKSKTDKPKPKTTKGASEQKDGIDAMTDHVAKLAVVDSAASLQQTTATDAKPEADPAKKLKALNKKLREITEIEAKPIESLTPEQVEKLGRKPNILAEIESLSPAAAKV